MSVVSIIRKIYILCLTRPLLITIWSRLSISAILLCTSERLVSMDEIYYLLRFFLDFLPFSEVLKDSIFHLQEGLVFHCFMHLCPLSCE